jgi:hypothetical protein
MKVVVDVLSTVNNFRKSMYCDLPIKNRAGDQLIVNKEVEERVTAATYCLIICEHGCLMV